MCLEGFGESSCDNSFVKNIVAVIPLRENPVLFQPENSSQRTFEVQQETFKITFKQCSQ